MDNFIINTKQQGHSWLIEFSNRIRLVYIQKKGLKNVYCGIMVGAGSKDESQAINGIAHFVEHTIFKKTKKRSAYQILSRVESVGGELNAYTTRENTTYYAIAERKYFGRIMELLTDLLYNSIFPEDELEKEKSVIAEEIEMYLDNPDETIHDHFHHAIFKNNALGLPILGTTTSLAGISRDDVLGFLKNKYTSDKTVVSITGSMNLDRVLDVATPIFEQVKPSINGKAQDIDMPPFTSFHKEEARDYQQVHCILGTRTFPVYDEQKYPLIVLNNLLGGDWMSSRLFMSVREKHGLVYNINTSVNLYQKSGLYLIHFATEDKKLDKAMKLVQNEIKKISSTKISSHELNRTKNQIKGQYSIMSENSLWQMLSNAKSVMNYNKIVDRKSYFDNISHVSAEEVIDFANKYLNNDNLCTLIYKITE